MNEDFATKAWADNHGKLSGGIANAIRTLLDSLKVLNDKQFDAPWRHRVCQNECPTH